MKSQILKGLLGHSKESGCYTADSAGELFVFNWTGTRPSFSLGRYNPKRQWQIAKTGP